MRPTAAALECPLAPPEHATVFARALHRACLIVGGIDELAKRLEVPKADLERWIRGNEEPPQRPFNAAVEIILLYAGGVGPAN
jgi:hypothetical protein